MTTNSFVTKSIALVLSIMLFSPFIAFAQMVEPAEDAVVTQTTPSVSAPIEPEVSDPVSVSETPTDSETPASETPVSDEDMVQDTAPAEEVVTGDALEGTVDPEAATSTETEIIPIVEATSTEPVTEDIPVVEDDTPVLAPDEVPVAAGNDLTVVEESLEPVVETVAERLVSLKDGVEELDPDFVIAISGKIIPTQKKGVVGAPAIMTPAATTIDGTDGTMTVSGSCASPYFVVLLFKNQTDYEIDPRSFIMNRAYPCENGSYSYSIDRLPPTLANGTYYLLVGEQRESGAWWPTTSLTEVSINRSN